MNKKLVKTTIFKDMKKENIFKCRIEYDDHGNIKVTSYSNEKMPGQLFNMLDSAVHQVREKYNNEAPWKKEYIQFEHNGYKYQQADASRLCAGCTFFSIVRCKHPYYLAGTRGDCIGKIYKKVEMKNEKNG
jgi:hypothetical protein